MLEYIKVLLLGLAWSTVAHDEIQMSSMLEQYVGDNINVVLANMTVTGVSAYWIEVQYDIDAGSIEFSFIVYDEGPDAHFGLCPPSSPQSNRIDTYSCRLDGLEQCRSYDLQYFGIPRDVNISDSYYYSILRAVLTTGDDTIPPTNLTCTALPSSLALNWVTTIPEECQAFFAVSWEGQAAWDENLLDTNSTTTEDVSFMLVEVIPGAEYTVDVTTQFPNNISGETASITCMTLDEQSSPPSLTVADTGTTFLYLTWEAPATPNGVIQNYMLKWTDEEGVVLNKTIDVVNHFNLTDEVFACSAYQVALTAINGAGLGLWDTKHTETLRADVSNVVCEDVSDSSVVVSWTPAPANCGSNGTTLSWHGESQWDEYFIDDSKQLEEGVGTFTLTELHPYTLYNVCVKLMEDWAEKICSDATTRQGVPASPEFSETSSTESSISLSWNETESWNGIPSKYVVTSTGAKLTEEVESNTTELTINELTEGTDYTVSVQACNEEQCSGETQKSVRTTGQAPQSNTGLIVGLALGFVAVVGAIAACLVVRARKRKRLSSQKDEEKNVSATNDGSFGFREMEKNLSEDEDIEEKDNDDEENKGKKEVKTQYANEYEDEPYEREEENRQEVEEYEEEQKEREEENRQEKEEYEEEQRESAEEKTQDKKEYEEDEPYEREEENRQKVEEYEEEQKEREEENRQEEEEYEEEQRESAEEKTQDEKEYEEEEQKERGEEKRQEEEEYEEEQKEREEENHQEEEEYKEERKKEEEDSDEKK